MIIKTTPRRIGYTLFVFFFLLIPFVARAQNEVAIGSTTTKANAILWLNGNGSQGLLLPVVANKSALSNPEKGMIVYDDSDNKIWYWNASAWVEASGGASGGGTVTTVSGTSPVVVANPNTTPVISLADGGVVNAKLANDAVTSSKILDGTITGADISNATVSVDKLSQSSALTGQVLKWNGTNWVPQNDDAGVGAVPTLNNGELLIGNGTSNAAATLTGDATLSAGVLTITNGVISGGKIANATITNANIANAAAIDVSKLAIGSNGQVLTTVAGIPTWSAGSTGTVTSVAAGTGLTGGPITSTGVLAVDVGLTAGKIVQLDGTARLPAVDGSQLTGLNASNISAGLLPLTRIPAGTAGDVLTTVAGVPAWQAPVTGVTTLDGLTDATVAAPASGQVLVNDGAGQFRNVNMSGDATISNAGALTITNGAIAGGLGGKIADGTITTDDLAPGAVSGGVGGIIIDATVTNADISAAAAIAVAKVAAGTNGDVLTTVAGTPTWQAPAASSDNQDLTLAGTTLSLVNDVTPVVLGGLSILNNVTTTEITDATILNADISAAAAIAVTKVAGGANGEVLTTIAGVPSWQAPVTGATALDGLTDAVVAAPASGQILVNDGAGQFRNVSMSLDATISSAGALTIANGAISGGVGGKIADATITAADLAAGSVSGGAGGIITDGTVTTADITDLTVTNTDISAAAAIAVTKVAAGTNGDVLTTVAGVPAWAAPVTGATTLDGLSDATVAAASSSQILVNDGAGQFRNVNMSGDATITTTGVLTIANGAISGGAGGKITDATITASDLAASSVSGGAAGIITDGTITTADITDGTITTTDIADLTITNTDISGSAAIAVTKVAAGVNGNVLTTVGGVPTWAAPAGGFSTLNVVPKGNGTTLVGSNIYDVGLFVGIGTSGPTSTLEVIGDLYQSGDYTYFNQTLGNGGGNMGVGAAPFSDAKLTVESDQNYGIHVTNTSGYAAGYFEGYVEVNGDQTVSGYLDVLSYAYVGGYLDVIGDAYVGGDLDVTGALSKGSGTFKIDHPLDPQNKFLYHSFVESPDMMNVYNGNIITDGLGEATVNLPEYFEALNKDFRYQLTAIGTFAQAIVYKKVANNSFVIKTDKPNVEVSWQVTGIRKDPYAEKNRVVPEVAKTGDQIGKYLYPEAYGFSAKKGNTSERKPKPPVKQRPAPQKIPARESIEKKP